MKGQTEDNLEYLSQSGPLFCRISYRSAAE